MPSLPPFGAQLIGQTEKTLRVILERLLAPTGLTEPQWIALVLACRGETPADADADTLIRRGLLNPDTTPTDAGQALYARVQAEIAPVTERLWGDLSADELATAGRVLAVVLQRAHAELAQAAR